MPGKNAKQILVIIMLFMFVPVCTIGAEAEKKLNFDPFSSEPSPGKNTKSDSGPIIPQVEFNNNEISMVFQIISDATGWSIFPTEEVSKVKINLWAKDITARELLDTVVAMAGFIYYRQDNVITVMTYEEYTQHHGLAKKVFSLKFVAATSVDAVIKPFLTKLGKSVVHKETNTIVLYETDANLIFITRVVEKLDVPFEEIVVEVINLKYADCESLAKILQSIFSSQQTSSRNKGSVKAVDAEGKQITADVEQMVSDDQMGIYAVNQANQLVIVGTIANVKKVKSLIDEVDVHGSNMVLEVIDLKYADSELLAEKLEQLFNKEKTETQDMKNNRRKMGTNASKEDLPNVPIDAGDTILSPQAQVYIQSLGRTNQLIIKAFKADFEVVKQLITKLDIYVEPITQNYQFTYIDASEIFNGLEKVLNLDRTNDRSGNQSGGRHEKNQGVTLVEKTNSILLTGPPSVHRIMTSMVEQIDHPNSYETGLIRIYKLENADLEEVAKTISELLETTSQTKDTTSNAQFSQETASGAQAPAVPGLSQSEKFVPQIEARVSVSKSTNSIVVQATARQHRELERLVKELDARRRQVLIEAVIVEVINKDDLDLGVELHHASNDLAAFTSFGLSTNINTATAEGDTIASAGGTATILQPDKVEVIIHALKADGHARITSAPKLLLNDNAVGFINSIAEEPTTQINQGETTTTTSFAGFVEAGTQFAITPHISQSDYLRVEYQIKLNSFGSKSSDPSIPPPRNTTSIQSEATVPEGYTIIVGGLRTAAEVENVDKIPLLGDIPILEWVFKHRTIEKQYKTTYLFITPHIMGKKDFADLKTVSQENLKEAEVKDNNKGNPDVNKKSEE
jgi:general secretion pathway protein D